MEKVCACNLNENLLLMVFPMASPREIIEIIRRKRFAIGLTTTDDEWRESAQEMREMMHRAVGQLSQDLNSKETHFVLELIQNADDNKYADGVRPELHFIIKPGSILIRNNEVGFNEKNVRAICDVGNSTKDRTASRGYIGEKGIGFKSVFRVSPEPHIFSNGFQFKFKDKDEDYGLGYIIPYWVDNTPDGSDFNQTNILLPLRGGTTKEIVKISDIDDPTLLLFLRRLKHISIVDDVNNNSFEVTRKDKDGRIVLHHGKDKDYWKLVRKPLTVRENLHEEKREGIKETEMVLGFPLKQDLSADTTRRPPVFAFLPTKEYGFRFIIQADFLLPTNREDIDKDKEWNRWLRDMIPECFVEAIEKFKADEHLKTTFYNYIPVGSNVSEEFFKPVVEKIHQLVQDTACILTMSGDWVKPEDIFRADETIRELLPENQLKEFFGKHYLLTSLIINRDVQDALKIPAFTINHLIECLESEEWIKERPDEWFKNLFVYLGTEKNKDLITEDHIEILRGLKLLRLENDDFKSVSENTVFFPLGKRSNYGFEKQVPLLSRGICEAENEEDQRAIEVFLERLGVRKASPYDIIQGYILPLFEDENEELNWQSKDNAFLIGCARYMRDNLDRYRTESDKVLARKQIEEPKKDPLEYLRKTLLLKLNKSTSEKSIYAHPESIYISKSYGNKNNLEDIFADIDNVWYVHDIYLEDSKKRFSPSKRSKISKRKQQQRNIERERGKWERFFLAIGLNDGFKVEKTGIIHLDNEERRKLRSYDGCTEEYITNYKLEHLDEILGMLESDHQKAALVFNALQRQWNKLQEYQQMEYEWFYYSRKGPIRVDAAWLHTLKTRAWIFTSHNKLAKPQEIFIEKPGIRDFLGATVPYVMVENEECARALGINFNATVKGVIFNLALLCHNKNDDKKAFLTFYKFLDSHFNDNAEVIKTVIEKHNLIFIPGTSQAYFSSDQVIWKDLSDIFGDTRGYLEKHYPGLRKFFVDNLGISERPTPKDYANALLNIREKEEIETKHEKVIDTIYRHLNIHLDPEQVEEVISEAEWWEEFSEDTIIWTDKGDFDTRFEDVYVNDHEDLYQLFRERPDISFFKLPARSHQKYRHLISTLEIPYLSQTIETEVVMKESAESEPELTEQLHGLLPYILRYIFNKANSIYENFKQEGSITELLEIKCYCLEKLEVVYTLGDHRANIEQQAKFDNGALYVQRERVGNLAYLAVEFAKLFESTK